MQIDIDKLKGMIQNDKKTIIVYAVLLIGVIAIGWHLFSGNNVPDNRTVN